MVIPLNNFGFHCIVSIGFIFISFDQSSSRFTKYVLAIPQVSPTCNNIISSSITSFRIIIVHGSSWYLVISSVFSLCERYVTHHYNTLAGIPWRRLMSFWTWLGGSPNHSGGFMYMSLLSGILDCMNSCVLSPYNIILGGNVQSRTSIVLRKVAPLPLCLPLSRIPHPRSFVPLIGFAA